MGYRMIDLSGLAGGWSFLLVAPGLLGAGVAYVVARKRDIHFPAAVATAIALAVPLLSPVLFVLVASLLHRGADAVDLDVASRASTSSAFLWRVNRLAHEDVSYFGPAGGWLTLGCVAILVAWAARRVPRAIGALALAVPLFIVLFGFEGKYNPWLGRLLLVPVAIALPLLAYAWRPPFEWTACALAAVTLVAVVSTETSKSRSETPRGT